MKQLILILLFTSISFAQSNMLLLMSGGYKNPETTLYLAGQTVSGTQATRIDNFITKVKDSLGISSLSTRFDVLNIYANESIQLALRNLVGRTYDTDTVGTIAFAQWEGFTSDGSTGYLNTNYIPYSFPGVFKQNSGSIGAYIRTNVVAIGNSGNCGMFGASSIKTGLVFQRLTTSARVWINQATELEFNPSSTSVGFLIASRLASNSVMVYRSNVLKNSSSAIGSSPSLTANLKFFWCAVNSSGTPIAFTTAQHSVTFIGNGLTPAEIIKFTNCVEWYMDALGKGVIP